MRSAQEFDAAKRLIAAGVNDCAIARQLGIPRGTVKDWRSDHRFGEAGRGHRRLAVSTMTSRLCPRPHISIPNIRRSSTAAERPSRC
ncbi:MAG TPA: helix-turn-helix domain-containing protein [Mycobacterium sp.]|nr:helix-turn-helix domain-containing protein [Mycobacterium sp.]